MSDLKETKKIKVVQLHEYIGVWDRGAGGAIAPPVGILAILQVNIDLPQFPGRLNHCTQVQHTCTGTVIEISL